MPLKSYTSSVSINNPASHVDIYKIAKLLKTSTLEEPFRFTIMVI